MVFNRRFRSRRRRFTRRFKRISKPFRRSVKRVVRQMEEVKLHGEGTSTTFATPSLFYGPFLDIAQGPSKYERIGNKVLLKRISWAFTVRYIPILLASAPKSVRVRVIVWRARQRPMTISNFDTAMFSLNDPNAYITKRDFNLTLYNSSGTTTVAGMPDQITKKGSWAEKQVVTFMENLHPTTDPKGQWGVFVVTDAPQLLDTQIAVDVFFRTSYRDI